MQFKTATYWICEDTIKSTIDCVYVYDDRAGIDTLFFDYGSIKEIYEYFDWHGRSTLDGYNYFYYVNQTWSNEESATSRI
ncbi:MAG TPA: hypothetical protein PKN75_07250 [Bacteroidia bacterium]|nr:hypothetical protein [Bacteroidia bacterium]HNU33373.1 hypothetical protein [Bacteroidia bacterium]